MHNIQQVSSVCLCPQTNASTSLHLAAEGGHHDVVKVLLAAGANPLEENAVSYKQLTILRRFVFLKHIYGKTSLHTENFLSKYF